jgi:uncharacterized membrane protein YcjF (UPF0283 family)
VPGRREEGKVLAEWSFGSVLWAMVVFFLWFMVIWMFIAIFADIFHRNDLSGWGKAGWIFLIFILPFLGILIYMIARPKMTEQDRAEMAELQAQQQRAAGYSPADEIAKLDALKAQGSITDAEYQDLKTRAIA